MKKLASILLSFIIAVTFTPALAFADEPDTQEPETAIEQIEQDAEAVEEPAAVEPAEETAEEVIAEEPAPAEEDQEALAEENAEIATEEAKNATELDRGYISCGIEYSDSFLVNNATHVYTLNQNQERFNAFIVTVTSKSSNNLTMQVLSGDGSIALRYNDYFSLCRKKGGYKEPFTPVPANKSASLMVSTSGLPKFTITNTSGSTSAYTIKVDSISAYDYTQLGEYKQDNTGAQVIVAALPKLNEDIVVQVHDNTGYFFRGYIYDNAMSPARWIHTKDGYTSFELGYGEVREVGYSNPSTSQAYLLIEKGEADGTISDDDTDFQDGKGVPKYYSYNYQVGFGIVPANLSKYTVGNIVDKTYTGSAIKQTKPRLYYGSVFLKSTDYTIGYANNKNVGSATIKFTAKAPFTGVRNVTYNIRPKGTSISKLTKGKKRFTVKWKKQTSKMSAARINSYQVQYSTNKNFTSPKIKTITGYKKYTKKITGLKKKTKYYVRVRTCMKVNGKWYYSTWSSAKTVKTK